MTEMDLKIKAQQDGPEDEDGMRLLELEETLAAIRQAGAKDSTRLKVDTSRRSRIRVVTGQLRSDDSDMTTAAGTGTPVGAVRGSGQEHGD